MGRIQITVTLTASNQLDIQPPGPVTIQDGDWVSWKFQGLSGDQFGFVAFDQRFGPFHSLRSFFTSVIAAKGNVGPPAGQTYPYKAIVFNQNVSGPSSTTVVALATSAIVNNATQVDTSPEVKVEYDHENRSLSVTPFTLSLNIGDTATWNIWGLPGDCFATIYFTLPSGVSPALFNPASGPFQAFYAYRGYECGDKHLSLRAHGTGFGLSLNAIAQFGYQIEIHDLSGATLAVEDPAIDNLGPPAPIG